MENDALDDFGSGNKPKRTVAQNVLRGMAGVGLASVITAVIFGSLSGPYGFIIALVAFLWSLPVFCVVLAVGFFIGKKNSEGGVSLLIGVCLLLFGFIVCGGFWF